MIATLPDRPKCQPKPRPPGWAALALVFALAAGMVTLAHGCHGPGEDHELFIRQIEPR